MKKLLLVTSLIISLSVASPVSAHRSGCHRWHTCPSDTGSYQMKYWPDGKVKKHCGTKMFMGIDKRCHYPSSKVSKYVETTVTLPSPPTSSPAVIPQYFQTNLFVDKKTLCEAEAQKDLPAIKTEVSRVMNANFGPKIKAVDDAISETMNSILSGAYLNIPSGISSIDAATSIVDMQYEGLIYQLNALKAKRAQMLQTLANGSQEAEALWMNQKIADCILR